VYSHFEVVPGSANLEADVCQFHFNIKEENSRGNDPREEEGNY
jgi:hypothetical protein